MNKESSKFLYENLANPEESQSENNQEPFTSKEALNISSYSSNEHHLFCGIKIKRRYITRTVWSIISIVILLVWIFFGFSSAVSSWN